MTLAWTQDTVGPLCRSVEDCALVFDAIYGPDGKDNSVLDVPFGWDATADVRKLRVGYLRSAFAGQPGETARQLATRRNNEEALKVIRGMGVQVVPFDLPDVEIAAIDFIRWAETAAAFDEPTRSGTLREVENGPEQSSRPADIRAGRFIPAVEYIQANRYRMRVMEQMDAAMSDLDLFLGANGVAHQPSRPSHPERAQRVLRRIANGSSHDRQVVRRAGAVPPGARVPVQDRPSLEASNAVVPHEGCARNARYARFRGW